MRTSFLFGLATLGALLAPNHARSQETVPVPMLGEPGAIKELHRLTGH